MRSSLSSSQLTEEEKRRKEASQRRILRIQQVREQEKQYALRLLDANKKQKSIQQQQILFEIKDEWETEKRGRVAKLQERIDYSIAHVGIAQTDANYLIQQQERLATQEYEQHLEERVQEAKRFDIAIEWAQSSTRQRQAPVVQKMEWRAQAMSAEKERSKAKVAQQLKEKEMKASQKENVNIEEQRSGPQIIKGKLAPHPNRGSVSYKATRFHENIQDEKPESPAKIAPVPFPKDSIKLMNENAYTAAIAIEQAEIMRADQAKEEQDRKDLIIKQRTIIAHTKFIAEKRGKEAEKVLAQFEQTTRRQKAQQIGEISRIVEQHAATGGNPVSNVLLDSEFTQDGILGLSWSSLPREKVAKNARKNKINRAFEEEFLGPAKPVTEETDKASEDIDFFSTFTNIPAPPPQNSKPINSNTASKPPSTSALKNKINRAKQPVTITIHETKPQVNVIKANTQDKQKENTMQLSEPNYDRTNQRSPTFTDENPLLVDFPLAHYLTPSLPSEPSPNTNTETFEHPSINQIHNSLFQEERTNDTYTNEPEEIEPTKLMPTPMPAPSQSPPYSTSSSSPAISPTFSPPSPSPPSLSPTSPQPQFPQPLPASGGYASEEFLRDFRRRMQELDERFHRSLGYLPSTQPLLQPTSHATTFSTSFSSPSVPVSQYSVSPPSSSSTSSLPADYRTASSFYSSPNLADQHSTYTPASFSSIHNPANQSSYTTLSSSSSQNISQSSPLYSHNSSVAPFVYHAASSPNVPPLSASPQSTPPTNLTYLTKDSSTLDNTSQTFTSACSTSFSSSTKPTPFFKPPPALPFGDNIEDYPVFTFVLDSPHTSSTPPPPPTVEDDDIFSISPLSSNPSPCLPSPPRSPYLSTSPLSNHSLSYSTDSLFMST